MCVSSSEVSPYMRPDPERLLFPTLLSQSECGCRVNRESLNEPDRPFLGNNRGARSNSWSVCVHERCKREA